MLKLIFLNDGGLCWRDFFRLHRRKWISDVTGINTVFDVEAGNMKLGLFLEKTLEWEDRLKRSSVLDYWEPLGVKNLFLLLFFCKLVATATEFILWLWMYFSVLLSVLNLSIKNFYNIITVLLWVSIRSLFCNHTHFSPTTQNITLVSSVQQNKYGILRPFSIRNLGTYKTAKSSDSPNENWYGASRQPASTINH